MLKDLRVAVLPPNVADQNIEYNAIMKLIATRTQCKIYPITDYFQGLNDDEINSGNYFTFLLDVTNETILNGCNIDGIHQNLVSDSFANGREIGDAELEIKSGMEVIEKDGYIGTIYRVYNSKRVSLCINGYNDTERDNTTHINDIRLPEIK